MSQKAKCAHCQLEYDKAQLKKVIEDSSELYFCCNGCESVYMLLKQSGLGGFYDRLGGNTLSPVEQSSAKQANFINSTTSRFSYLDDEHFLEKHTTKSKNSPKQKNNQANNQHDSHLLEAHLIIEGIHCAACVWLNEAALQKQQGIISANINYTNNKAKIVFDPRAIKLSAIFSLISSIGYEAHIYDPSTQENLLTKESKSYFTSFVVGVFCTMSIMMVAIAQYAGYFKGMSADMKSVLNLISCLLATPVLFFTGRVFFVGAYYGVKQGYVGMDFLVAFGASLTFAYSVYASFAGVGEPYFESVAMIVLFVFSGKFLEIRARALAGDSLDKLQHILPSAVLVEIEGENGEICLRPKDSKELAKDDIVHIREGEMLPCDGVMLTQGSIDTRSLSGESEPVQKVRGDEVLSGSIACESFCYAVQKTYADSTMSNIIKLLEESLESKPKIQNLANALSKHFSRVVLFIALCGFVFWWGYADAQKALIIAISVIVISCPCALALATPIASVVGISRGFREGVLFKQARFLETLAKCEVVLFDKTGTLTQGKLAVKKEFDFDTRGDFGKNLLVDFLSHFTHPIALALKDFLEQKNLRKNATKKNAKSLKEVKQTSQRGIYGIYEDKQSKVRLLGGSLEYLQSQGVSIDEASKIAQNYPQMSIFAYAVENVEIVETIEAHQKDKPSNEVKSSDSISETKTTKTPPQIHSLYLLQDSLKNGAKELVASLKKAGKKVLLISGDRQCVVESIAKELGIENYKGALLPKDKLEIIRSHKNAVMIGDGLNDILALQSAEVGIAMGAGSAMAIAQGDVVVLDDSLEGVGRAFSIAKRTYSRIKQNLAISLVYNALLIPLALCGFVIPLVAALSMSLSSLLVVANSMRK